LLPIEKRGELLTAPPEFCLVISYNPGYQSILKDLKQSTRQRFVALEFNYPSASHEQRIIEKETSSDSNIASRLVKLGSMTRNLKGNGLDEGASTRLLVNAAKLISGGISPVTATDTAIAQALTDDVDMLEVIQELCRSVF
jgi:nitric oxide reductase NorQ protein